MLLAALVACAAAGAFLLGYALAARLARQRFLSHARRSAALHDELERRLIRLGVGLGIGA
jgi:hypothetical protein